MIFLSLRNAPVNMRGMGAGFGVDGGKRRFMLAVLRRNLIFHF